MANEEHLKILKQGVEAWNKWRTNNPETHPDLSRAELRGANLSWGFFLNNAKLERSIERIIKALTADEGARERPPKPLL